MIFIMLDGDYTDNDYFCIITSRNTVISAPLWALFHGGPEDIVQYALG